MADFDCGKKPARKPKDSEQYRFRSTQVWQRKRDEIRERDNQLCQVCIRLLYDTEQQYTYDGLSVHHINPLKSAYDKRLDNDNLITLCEMHHEMAEHGLIPARELDGIAKEQEKMT